MQHSLCRFLTVDICALIASCYRVVFLVIVSSSIQGLCIWNSTRLVFSNWKSKCCPFPPETEKKKERHSNLPEDLRPPLMLLYATRGFPHGNFYTSWQRAQTPGLRKTPNDDWEHIHTVLKTCWVANIGVCRKAGSWIGGGGTWKERIWGGGRGEGRSLKLKVEVSNGTR